MTENQENLEKVAMALYVYAAQLIKEGKSREDIIAILMQRGVERDSAETIMTRLNESRDNVSRRSAYIGIIFGAIVMSLGLFPIFGIILEPVEGVSVIVALLVMAVGIVIIGRALIRIISL